MSNDIENKLELNRSDCTLPLENTPSHSPLNTHPHHEVVPPFFVYKYEKHLFISLYHIFTFKSSYEQEQQGYTREE